MADGVDAPPGQKIHWHGDHEPADQTSDPELHARAGQEAAGVDPELAFEQVFDAPVFERATGVS